MKKLSITLAGVAISAVAALTMSPTANATQAGFLQGMSEANILITNANGALTTGYLVCGALDNGYDPIAVAGAVMHDVPTLTPYQAGYVVGLAIRELC